MVATSYGSPTLEEHRLPSSSRFSAFYAFSAPRPSLLMEEEGAARTRAASGADRARTAVRDPEG